MEQSSHPSPVIIFYDGWCSICVRSSKMFERLDRGREVIRCVDIRSDDPQIHDAGVDIETLSKSLHALTADGTLLNGPEAIRHAMDALGRGRRVAWTRWAIVRPIIDWAYRVFARNRLRWFGLHACRDDHCSIDAGAPGEGRP